MCRCVPLSPCGHSHRHIVIKWQEAACVAVLGVAVGAKRGAAVDSWTCGVDGGAGGQSASSRGGQHS